MNNDCPCMGCVERREIGCHAYCGEYKKWYEELQMAKKERHVEKPELSKSMMRHIWRKMLGR